MKLESVEVNGLDAWDEAGRKLKKLDAKRFSQVLALARAYVASYEREPEDPAIVQSRIAQILGGSSRGSA